MSSGFANVILHAPAAQLWKTLAGSGFSMVRCRVTPISFAWTRLNAVGAQSHGAKPTVVLVLR